MDLYVMDKLKVKTEVIKTTYAEKHIVFGVDRNYIPRALVVITSIIESNPDEVFNFHIITDYEENSPNNIIKDVFDNLSHGLTYHVIDSSLLSGLPSTKLFTLATYFRIFSPVILPNASFILYLDADMIIKGSISDLWDSLSNSNNIAAVVEDRKELQKYLSSGAKLKGSKYFNAGMMLINVKKWNESKITEKALSLLSLECDSFRYLDQDALNNVLEGRLSYISHRYNYLVFLRHDDGSYYLNIPSNISIIHYTGSNKPWQVWNKQAACSYFIYYLKKCKMKISLIDKPENLEQVRGMYKSYFRAHSYMKGLFWRVKFIIMRKCKKY